MGLFNFFRRSSMSPVDSAAMRRYIEVEYGVEIRRATRNGADHDSVVNSIINRMG